MQVSKAVSLLVFELDVVLADDTGLAGTGDGEAEAGRDPVADGNGGMMGDGVSTGDGEPVGFDGVLVDEQPCNKTNSES